MRLLAEEGLACDVASGGELALALRAGFDPGQDPPARQRQVRARAARRRSTPASATSSSTTSTSSTGSQRLVERRARASACCCASRPASARTRTRTISTGGPNTKFGFNLDDAREAIARLRRRRPLRPRRAALPHRLADPRPRAVPPGAARRCARSGDFRDLQPRRRPRRRLHERPAAAGDRRLRRREGRGRRTTCSAPASGSPTSPAARSSPTRCVTLYSVETVKRNVVDLGRGRRRHVGQPAPDALRRALRGARRRPPRRRDTRCHLAGKHCESRRRARRATPSWTTRGPATSSSPRPPAPTATRWPTTTTASRARPSSSAGRRRPRRRAARDLRRPLRPRCLTPSASACSATAPSAPRSPTLLPRARRPRRARHRPAPRDQPASSRAPAGDFEEILAGSDLIVELMGGLDPARDYVLRAMAAGKHVVTANKQLLCRHGEELWAAAREHGVQLRFEAAVAGVVPVIRVLQESLAAAHVERLHGIVNGTTNFILTEMARTGASYAEALAEAQRLGYAEADPTEDVNGARRRREDGDPRAAGLRHAGQPRPGPLRGHRAHHGRRHRVRARPRALAEADRHGRARRRRAQRPRAPGVPLRRAPAGVGPRARSTR